MKPFKAPLLLLAAVFLLSSCGGYQIVQKPEAARGKKLALVSIFGNRSVRDLSGDVSLTGLAGAFGSSSEEKEDKGEAEKSRFLANRMLIFAEKVYVEELGRVPGWTIVPLSEARQNPAYRGFVEEIESVWEGMSFIKSMIEFSIITPKGVPMVMGDEPLVTEAAGRLAESLGVDAVVAIEVDLAYDIQSTLGIGSARPGVGAAIWIYNRNGEIIAETPWARAAGDFDLRRFSEDSVTTVLGIFSLSEERDPLFEDSIREGAIAMREKITSDLRGK